jgi:uncharacterized protein YbaP (TraB family)
MLFETGYPHITILGSIHIWDDAPFALGRASTAAFDSAQRVVFEQDSCASVDLSMARYHPGETLQSAIVPDLFARTEELWAQLGYPGADLLFLKPWYAALSIGVDFLWKAGLNPYGVDHELLGRAVECGKRIEHLEAAEDGLVYFDSAPRDEQERSLAEVIACPEREAVTAMELLRAFRHGDRAVFSAILAERMEALPHTYGGLVTQRNALWADRIKRDFIDDGIPTLIIVGGLHGAGLADELQPTATP